MSLKLPKGTPVLDMNDPDFANQFRDAIGVKRGDTINIVTPQFKRPENDPPPASVPTDWTELRSMSCQALKEIGLRAWDEPKNGKVLMLLPGEWYTHIPIGFELECINGKVAPHATTGKDRTDDDIRFGCLAYGIRVIA